MYAAPNNLTVTEQCSTSSTYNSNVGPTPSKKQWEKTPQNLHPSRRNAVRTLQNLQKQNQVNYKLVSQLGPQHSPTFVYCVEVDGHRFEGSGRSKKLAKQAAADASLWRLLQSKKAPERQQTTGHVTATATDANVCDISSIEMNRPPIDDPRSQKQGQNLEPQLESKQPVFASSQASMGVQVEAMRPVATGPKASMVSQLERKLPVATNQQASVVSQLERKLPVATNQQASVVSQLERKLPVATNQQASVVSQLERKLPVATNQQASVVSQLEKNLPVATNQQASMVPQIEVKGSVSTDTKAVKPQLDGKPLMSANTVGPQEGGKIPLVADSRVFVEPQIEPKAPVSADTKLAVWPQIDSKLMSANLKATVGPQMNEKLPMSADTKLLDGKPVSSVGTKAAAPAVGPKIDHKPMVVNANAAVGPQENGKPMSSVDTKGEVKKELCRVLGNAFRAEIQTKLGQHPPQALQHKVESDRLKEGHELGKACDLAQRWLTCGLGHLSKLLLVSADRSVLQQQLERHEQVYCEMMEKKHELIQLLNKGHDFLSRSPQQRSIIDAMLHNDLDKIQQDWDQLSKETMDRNTRLKTCMEHYRKYSRMQDSSLPWLGEAESRLETLRPNSFSKEDISRHLNELKSFRNEVWCHTREFKNTRTLGDTFLTACDMDREVMFNELATMKQRWDALNKDVTELIDSLADVERRLTNYNNDIQGMHHLLHCCEETLNFYNGLRRVSSNSKHIRRMKATSEEIDALKPTLNTLREQASCLVSLAAGYKVTSIQGQFEGVAKRLDKLQARVDNQFSELQSAVTAITKFNDQVKRLTHDLGRLEEELDAMKPPARDIYTVHTQMDDTIEFLCKISKVTEDVAHTFDAGKELVDAGSAVDTQATREQVEKLQQQLGRLKERARGREGILESTLQRLKGFKQVYRSMVQDIANTWKQVERCMLVDNEVQRNKNHKFLVTTIGALTAQWHECNRIGHSLIQSAAVGVDTRSLEKTLEKMNRKWNNLKEKALYESNKTMPLPDSTSRDPPTSQMASADSTSSANEPVSSSVPSQVLRSKPVEVIDLSDDDDIVCLGPQTNDKEILVPVLNEMAECSSSGKRSSGGIEGQTQTPLQPCRETSVPDINESSRGSEKQNSDVTESQVTSVPVRNETPECNRYDKINTELSSDEPMVQQPIQSCQQDQESSVPLANEMAECNRFKEEKSDLLCDDIEFVYESPVVQQESEIRICEAWSAQDLDIPIPVPSTIYVYSQEIESNESDLPENILHSVQQELMDAPLHAVDLGEKGSPVQRKTTLDSTNSEKSTPVIPTVTTASDSASTSPKQPNNSDPGDVRTVTLTGDEVRLIEKLIEFKIAFPSSTVASSVNSETGKQCKSSSSQVPTSLLKRKRSPSKRAASTAKTKKEDQIRSATKRKKETVPQEKPPVKNEKLSSKRTPNDTTAAKKMKQDVLPENLPAVRKRGRPSKTLQVESKEEGSPAPQSSRKNGRIGQQSNTEQQSKLQNKSTGKRKSKGSAKQQQEDAQCPVCQGWYLSDTSQGEWLECVSCKDWIHERCTLSSDYCRECCSDAQCPECQDWFYMNMSNELWVKCLRCCRWTHKKCTPSEDFCKACNDDINK